MFRLFFSHHHAYTSRTTVFQFWPTADPEDKLPYKNLSDTSPFHSRRQEQPEDLPTGKYPPPPITNNSGHLTPYRQ